VLWSIFGPGNEKVRVEFKKMHNEKLNDRYCSPNIVLVTNSRRMS